MRHKDDPQPIKQEDIERVLEVSKTLRKDTGNYTISLIVRGGIVKFIEVTTSKGAPRIEDEDW